MDIASYVFVKSYIFVNALPVELTVGSESYVFVDSLRVVHYRVEALHHLVAVDLTECLMVP